MPEEVSIETSKTLECHNPATGEEIATFETATNEEIESAVERARRAQARWKERPLEERIEVVSDAKDKLIDRRREVADLVLEDCGKTRTDAVMPLVATIDAIDYYLKIAPEVLGTEEVDPHLLKQKGLYVRREPYGVALNISPWNYPVHLSLLPAFGALIGGNAAIVKPSEYTTLSVTRTVEFIQESSLPSDLLQVVPGEGDVGSKLIEYVDTVQFTGSIETGRKVNVKAAEQLIPCTLELGGNDAAVVLDDADVDRAAEGIAWGGLSGAGQICVSTERVYVDESIADPFLDRVVDTVEDLRQGDPAEREIDVGAMTRPEQVDHVEAHVEDAVEKGAEVLVGGDRDASSSGHFFEPTVLTDVDPSMDVMRDETFGPVLPIAAVGSPHEALERANDTRYGLSGSVWSGDLERARSYAAEMEAGSVCINDELTNLMLPEAPFGGFKDSGIGRRVGPWELRKYTQTKAVEEDRFALEEPFWFPYSDEMADWAERLTGLFKTRHRDKLADLLGLDV